MAAFMNRLGALGPGKTPVVNADRVDGYHADELINLSGGTVAVLTEIPDRPTEVSFGEVLIEVPTEGFVVVNAAVTIENSCAAAECNVYGRLRHVGSGAVGQWMLLEPTSRFGTMSFTAIFEVGPGGQLFDVRLSRDASGDGTQNGWWGQLTATFSPYGQINANTTALPNVNPEAPPPRNR